MILHFDHDSENASVKWNLKSWLIKNKTVQFSIIEVSGLLIILYWINLNWLNFKVPNGIKQRVQRETMRGRKTFQESGILVFSHTIDSSLLTRFRKCDKEKSSERDVVDVAAALKLHSFMCRKLWTSFIRPLTIFQEIFRKRQCCLLIKDLISFRVFLSANQNCYARLQVCNLLISNFVNNVNGITKPNFCF